MLGQQAHIPAAGMHLDSVHTQAYSLVSLFQGFIADCSLDLLIAHCPKVLPQDVWTLHISICSCKAYSLTAASLQCLDTAVPDKRRPPTNWCFAMHCAQTASGHVCRMN